MQVGENPSKESMAWLRILENVVVVADASKLSRATGDQWCSTICRCLSSLLQGKGAFHPLPSAFRPPVTRLVDKEMAILQQGAAVTLRLSLIPETPRHSLHGVLSCAVAYLQHLEHAIHLCGHHRSLRQPVEYDNPHPHALPPHRAQGLLDAPPPADPLQTWGEVVEVLWRVAMSLDDDGTHAWAMLTRRLLVWRALVGEEACGVGEWARKEVVLALRLAE